MCVNIGLLCLLEPLEGYDLCLWPFQGILCSIVLRTHRVFFSDKANIYHYLFDNI